MSSTGVQINRSNLLIISFQLDAACVALRHSMSCGIPPGPGTLKTLRALHQGFASIHRGPSLDPLPAIDEQSTASDILMFAELLRAAAAAFLSPDELTEKGRAIGFQSEP